MIDRNHSLPITRQAELLDISRGTVYYLPKPTSEADLDVMKRLAKLHLRFPFMGARMFRDQLRLQGLIVGRRHIGTLMKKMGIESLAPRPGTSQRHPGHKIYPYLLGHLPIVRANQVWALDTTYIPIARGFVYLTAVIDVYTRKELAHRVATSLEACHAKDALEEAFKKYGKPDIVNTDQGSQFTAEEFTKSVLGAGCQLSMDGKGAWRDNVFIERVWRSAKYEWIYLRAYSTVAEAKADIAKYFKWYNAGRPHSSLNHQVPNDAYFDELPTLKRAA